MKTKMLFCIRQTYEQTNKVLNQCFYNHENEIIDSIDRVISQIIIQCFWSLYHQTELNQKKAIEKQMLVVDYLMYLNMSQSNALYVYNETETTLIYDVYTVAPWLENRHLSQVDDILIKNKYNLEASCTLYRPENTNIFSPGTRLQNNW